MWLAKSARRRFFSIIVDLERKSRVISSCCLPSACILVKKTLPIVLGYTASVYSEALKRRAECIHQVECTWVFTEARLHCHDAFTPCQPHVVAPRRDFEKAIMIGIFHLKRFLLISPSARSNRRLRVEVVEHKPDITFEQRAMGNLMDSASSIPSHKKVF